jgi:hypothetical protein
MKINLFAIVAVLKYLILFDFLHEKKVPTKHDVYTKRTRDTFFSLSLTYCCIDVIIISCWTFFSTFSLLSRWMFDFDLFSHTYTFHIPVYSS